MGFSLDIKDMDKYYTFISVVHKDFDKFLSNFLKKCAMEVLRETKRKQTGHEGKQFMAYDTGAMTNAWSIGDVIGKGTNIYIEINNPMEYASDIEYGHRIVVNGYEVGWYEGRFMLKTSIDDMMSKMPLRYAWEFADYCEKRGWKHD